MVTFWDGRFLGVRQDVRGALGFDGRKWGLFFLRDFIFPRKI